MKHVIAFDIGATNMRVAIVDELGAIKWKDSQPTVKNDKAAFINQIISLINLALEQTITIDGIGIGIPGPTDPITGFVHDLPNIGVFGLDMKTLIEKAFNIPTTVINDANAAGYAEALIGAGQGHRVVQYITLSTGIGGALIYEGKLVLGTHGFAQEIGNMIIDPRRKAPNLSMNEGSFESWCSGKSLIEMANDYGVDVKHAGEVFINDKLTPLVEQWFTHLGMALGNIINLYEPDIIIFGGGLMKSSKHFIDKIGKYTQPFIYKALENSIIIKKAQYDQDAGLIGAGLYCLHRIN